MKVKCIVWDLDNTIWNGVLIQDNNVEIRDNIVKIIKELDNRGILQSIASKNDYELAVMKLKELDIFKYFLYPQINWMPKSKSIKYISEKLNINIDSFAFVDDEQYELDEVIFSQPAVLCIQATQYEDILDMKEFIPEYITDDSKNRRLLYQNDIIRNNIEAHFSGTKEDFLKSLNMDFSIMRAEKIDLQRVYELTLRTNQLNTSGETYSYDELCDFIDSEEHELLVASLRDRYGDYGKIGIALIQKKHTQWDIKLFLMSCRVMNRGIGTVFIGYLIETAQAANVRLITYFTHTSRNKMMYMTYKLCGFRTISANGQKEMLEYDVSHKISIPNYIKLNAYNIVDH